MEGFANNLGCLGAVVQAWIELTQDRKQLESSGGNVEAEVVENVDVAKKNKNVMIAGDGTDFNIVTSSLSVLDGSTTFRSASLDQKSTKLRLSLQGAYGKPKNMKKFLRAVVVQSYIGGLVNRTVWAEWSMDFALKTLYYGKSSNSKPGAGVSKRVNRPGYHVISDPNEAKQVTVAELIQGGAWLESTGVSFTQGL
ncbi:PREDICTED: pectinesterase 3-like [Populus euphratica]|uniref:Pectinesterase 3-like n=1 Tax=Populus euphratica TaxID=75702 RepID=A0AAJ6YAC5_POPEU|nr:PREDICTED: pectinesterase 3-like [Populus euphratica]